MQHVNVLVPYRRKWSVSKIKIIRHLINFAQTDMTLQHIEYRCPPHNTGNYRTQPSVFEKFHSQQKMSVVSVLERELLSKPHNLFHFFDDFPFNYGRLVIGKTEIWFFFLLNNRLTGTSIVLQRSYTLLHGIFEQAQQKCWKMICLLASRFVSHSVWENAGNTKCPKACRTLSGKPCEEIYSRLYWSNLTIKTKSFLVRNQWTNVLIYLQRKTSHILPKCVEISIVALFVVPGVAAL